MTTTTLDGAPTRRRREWMARLDRPRVQLAAVLLLGWLPFVTLGAFERILTGRTEPLLRDFSVHVRLLVAVPLLVVSELALAAQSALTLRRLADEGFVGDELRARFDALARRSERLRRARSIELILLVAVLAYSLATLAGWYAGAFAGLSARPLDATRVWFAVVTLPLFLFLVARSLWHWTIWVLTLVGLARLPLRLAAGHPDRRGGIGFLTLPSLAFAAPFLLAASSVLCAASGTHILRDGAELRQFRNLFIAFVVVGELLALGPLSAFAPRLFLFGRAALADYGGLATDYVRRFRRRWLAPTAPRDQLLGTSDIQSLNDLGGAFRETAQRTSPLLFGPSEAIALLVVMLLPTVPLLVAVTPLDALLRRLAKLLLGAH